MAIDGNKLLEAQLRQNFGGVVYSHKTHEKCSDILLRRLTILKITQIVLSAITSGSFLSVVFFDETIAATIGASMSMILLILNAYTKDYDLGELAQKHKQAANSLWAIREKYFSLLTDIRSGHIAAPDARSARDKLNGELAVIYESSPPTFSKAYQLAQIALRDSEELTFSDEEIDGFLPNKLRVK